MKRPTLLVGLSALLLGGVVQYAAHASDVVLAFWDAQAHLDIARRVVDSLTPGLQMLGTVWLPVPHLLYLPFVQIDPWWWNGFAGGIVGLAAYALTVVAVYRIVARHADRARTAGVAAALVALNPTLLYLQTTAMTETLLLGFLTTAVDRLDHWLKSDNPRDLWLAGCCTALAVGSRYDGWFFAAVAAAVVLVHTRRVGAVLRFAALPALMVLAWLAYNAYYSGDPLEFQRGFWSAANQQQQLAARGLLPTRGAPLLDLGYYLGAAGLTVGWVVLVMGGLGSAIAAVARRARVVLLLLWSVLGFNLLALWLGQSVIALPWTTPAGVLNLRYGVMLLPAVAVGVALEIERLTIHRAALVAVGAALALQVGLYLWQWPSQVGGLREALAIRDGDIAQMDASRWLARHYDRGRVLVAPAVNLSPRTRIAMRDRIYPWSWELGPAALAAPAEVVDWVIVDRRATDDPVTHAVQTDTVLSQRFQLAFRERDLEIWQRR
jgi:4-amino-4-deoxy-L-arabinose transferase-like glycosyltransferase